MASIRNRGGKWQARVIRKGYPEEARTFTTRTAAERWARSVEADIDRGTYVSQTEAQRTTLAEVIDRYVREVLPSMRSADDDRIRLNALKTRPIARLSMAALTPERLPAYRDERLAEVTPATVTRDLARLSSIINHARREWGIHVTNPVAMIRRPTSSPGRSRTLSLDEQSCLLAAVEPTGRRSVWLKPLILLALETAMRRGELLGLCWKNVDLKQRVAHLPMTKNGDARSVPLSSATVEVLISLPRSICGRVIPMQAAAVWKAFDRAAARAGLADLRFHDLRHTAITRMAERLPNLIELSAASGHRSLRMLQRYYHPSVTELARKLG